MGASDYLNVSRLPTLNGQAGRAVPKGESRLQVSARAEQVDVKAEEKWRKAVRKRDQMHCRKCQRVVKVILDRLNERAECHHVNGKDVKAIRWDVRNGLLTCLACHELLTGKVNERWAVVSRHVFTVAGVRYTNGSKPLTFERII